MQTAFDESPEMREDHRKEHEKVFREESIVEDKPEESKFYGIYDEE